MAMTTAELDQAKSQAFSQRLLSMLNEASLSLMVATGHQTGLFDAMAGLPPSTSEQIADATGLNERYVRERRETVAAEKVVEYDPTARACCLPRAHACWLSRSAGQRNVAVM